MGNLQEEIDLKKTIEISARRFEESPYIERTQTSNTVSYTHLTLPTKA